MSAGSEGVGELSYGTFYLPAFAFGYLAIWPDNPILQHLPQVDLIIFSMEPVYFVYLLTGVSFLGAMQLHGVARAIYGPEGPSVRPKHSIVQLQHTIAIICGLDAEEVPIIPCRILNRGLLPELLDYVHYCTQRLIATNPEAFEGFENTIDSSEPLPHRHRIEIGIDQLVEFMQMLSWRDIPRISYFLPMEFHRINTWLAFLFLIFASITSTASYISLLLIFALSVLLFRGIVWSPIPDYYDIEGLQDRHVAEYELVEREEEN